MDHDAMWTHVLKLMKFRDDFLILSRMTGEQFHEKAEEARCSMAAELEADARDETASNGQDDGSGSQTGEQTADKSDADASKDAEGTKLPGDPNIAPVGSTEAATGV